MYLHVADIWERSGTAIFVSSLFCFQVKLLPKQTGATYDIHGLWSWVAWVTSAAGGEDPGEGKNSCPRAISMTQYLQRDWDKQEGLGEVRTVLMAAWQRRSPTWCCTGRMRVRHSWHVLNECAQVAMQHVGVWVSALFCMDLCERGVCRWEASRTVEAVHLSYLFTHSGELEIMFSPIFPTDVINFPLLSIADCGEWHGQVYTMLLNLCVLSWLTDLLQTLWHGVENGSLTAEGICPSWRCESFLGQRSCCVLPASILADC